MHYAEFRARLAALNPSRDLGMDRRGSEENVKLKLTVPFFQCLGWDVLSDMDCEYLRTDLVLLDDRRQPAIIVEVKAWDELLARHLDQCLEYTYACRTPWIVVTTGQRTRLYCSLLNPRDLSTTAPLLEFSLEDLLHDTDGSVFNGIAALLGKSAYLNGATALWDGVRDRLAGTHLEQAQEDFLQLARTAKSRLKTIRLTDAQFLVLATRHPEPVCRNLVRLRDALEDWARQHMRLRVRYRSKEIGLEYLVDSGPRPKRIGLFGVYPGDAHEPRARVAFGLEGWQELRAPQPLYERLRTFPREIQSDVGTNEMIRLVTEALRCIGGSI